MQRITKNCLIVSVCFGWVDCVALYVVLVISDGKLHYDQRACCLVCLMCPSGQVLNRSDLEHHLNDEHDEKLSQEQKQKMQGLRVKSLVELQEQYTKARVNMPIIGLRITDAWQCASCTKCGLVTSIRTHRSREKHSANPEPVKAQRFHDCPTGVYFRVLDVGKMTIMGDKWKR